VDGVPDPDKATKLYHSSGECGVARFDGDTGDFLGWWMHPDPGTGPVETPATGSNNKWICISLGPDNRVYVVAGSPEHIHERLVHRYELDGTPAPGAGQTDALFIKQTGYYGDLRSTESPVAFTDSHVYVAGENYSGEYHYHVFRYNYDGSYAGTQGGADARFTSNLMERAYGLAVDANGNVHVSHDASDNVDRYDTSGIPDAGNPWVTTTDRAKFLAFDTEGRLYVAVAGGIHRWDTSGSPAGNPGALPGPEFAKDGTLYTLDDDPYYARATWRADDIPVVHVSPDGIVYGGNPYVHQYNPPYSDWWQNGVMRWDPGTGDMLDDGRYFANIGADAAPLVSPTGGMLFVTVPPRGMLILVK
jgi:hypothetical protein